ncbi:hypothetical protein P152DRAFT_442879 [Eremomyces bilateralis CBS 781.70]|uniref:Golgi apparatus membrane protein TVP38 n=1 Tax=Eremomyces bilateralis CBS 781.70 TaxID=1392243 RepID=A0A6G1FTE9_9PEZI|nr:uncharacterized protein P152DRAFT_442879 [Eremomyces bilateralis CBS 781.70]KAF1808962.1 hypothetical protein P152DRAFT_442879 [Eremomyces bilateralis CBS 781.70]
MPGPVRLYSRERSTSPVWERISGVTSPFLERRDSRSYSRPPESFQKRFLRQYNQLQLRALRTFDRLSFIQKILVIILGIVTVVLTVLLLIYNERIFVWLAPWAKKWGDLPAGWLILWVLMFIVSVPPLIGYSTFLAIAGFVFGFPNGWFIAATSTILGSTMSFIVSRAFLRNLSKKLAADPRFAALALTLKHDGLKLLVMIRLCPLPYSLANGAIATIPTVHWAGMMGATAIASPRLMLAVFVGAKLREIGDNGEKMDAKTRAVSYLSILIGILAGAFTGWFIYRQTKKRAQQLEGEERTRIARESEEELAREYEDDPEAGYAAEVIREDIDDISLHEQYRDDYNEEGFLDADDPIPRDGVEDATEIGDVFDLGDASEGDEDKPLGSK